MWWLEQRVVELRQRYHRELVTGQSFMPWWWLTCYLQISTMKLDQTQTTQHRWLLTDVISTGLNQDITALHREIPISGPRVLLLLFLVFVFFFFLFCQVVFFELTNQGLIYTLDARWMLLAPWQNRKPAVIWTLRTRCEEHNCTRYLSLNLVVEMMLRTTELDWVKIRHFSSRSYSHPLVQECHRAWNNSQHVSSS